MKAKNPGNAKLPDAYSLFGPSIKALRLNPITLGALFVVPLVLPYADHLALGNIFDSGVVPATFAVLGTTIFLFIGLLSVISSFIAELASAKSQKISLVQTLQEGLKRFWRLFGLLLVMMLIIGVGLLLLIIPGIFALQRLLLAPYFMVDQDLGIKASIRASFKAGKKHSSAMWGVLGILLGISILGAVPIVGLFISIVLGLAYLCATAIRYLQIKNIS